MKCESHAAAASEMIVLAFLPVSRTQCSLLFMVTSWSSLAVMACMCASAQRPRAGLDQPRSPDAIAREAMALAQSQRQRLGPYSVSRRYTIENTHLKKPAVLQVLWTYTPGKGKQFRVVRAEGVSGLTRRALMRILETEEKNSHLAVDPASIDLKHYSFKLAAQERSDYKLQLTPLHKSKYLINGYAVVSRKDSAIVRVEGRTSKRISFWVSEADVIQEYANDAGFWLPSKTKSTASVRLVGKTRLTIDSGEYQFADSRR